MTPVMSVDDEISDSCNEVSVFPCGVRGKKEADGIRAGASIIERSRKLVYVSWPFKYVGPMNLQLVISHNTESLSLC